ncbi:MAG: PepSY domain-containing protein [Gammaproteobacteria bacterium]|nr:PepSY domain-containing protein [Gammaproteobacteria bacterium]MDP2141490.1 PepSY domain-containing protein [Gammaproteobacteria bacterium]MDP2347485.1 PepSY domain-containing protein [Gammaproteobacteria bacterium]
MNHRKYHRIVGIIMLTPLITWALTGMFFLVQPGYGAAYEMLSPRTYPLTEVRTLPAAQEWTEFRYLRTILGEHLLVRGEQGWRHLDPGTLEEFPAPQEQAVRSLVIDAIARNPQRYGEVETFVDGEVRTSTGVNITLDWNTLSLRQMGNDTRWIDQLYQIHYLQWTGIRVLDKVLGVVGLFLLVLMTITGFRLAFRISTTTPD